MRRFLSICINLFIARAVFAVSRHMFFIHDDAGFPVRLSVDGLQYLKYFTVLSNLMMGLSAFAFALALLLAACGVAQRVPKALRKLKYAATCAVGLTFATALCFLGPRSGFQDTYDGPNLWFHLIVPLAAMLDFTLIDREGRVARRDARLALPLPGLYGAAYLGNLIANGYGGPGHPNDWYGLADGGPLGAWLFLPVLLLAARAVAALLRAGRGRR